METKKALEIIKALIDESVKKGILPASATGIAGTPQDGSRRAVSGSAATAEPALPGCWWRPLDGARLHAVSGFGGGAINKGTRAGPGQARRCTRRKNAADRRAGT